jgi:hypothetical protein
MFDAFTVVGAFTPKMAVVAMAVARLAAFAFEIKVPRFIIDNPSSIYLHCFTSALSVLYHKRL